MKLYSTFEELESITSPLALCNLGGELAIPYQQGLATPEGYDLVKASGLKLPFLSKAFDLFVHKAVINHKYLNKVYFAAEIICEHAQRVSNKLDESVYIMAFPNYNQTGTSVWVYYFKKGVFSNVSDHRLAHPTENTHTADVFGFLERINMSNPSATTTWIGDIPSSCESLVNKRYKDVFDMKSRALKLHQFGQNGPGTFLKLYKVPLLLTGLSVFAYVGATAIPYQEYAQHKKEYETTLSKQNGKVYETNSGRLEYLTNLQSWINQKQLKTKSNVSAMDSAAYLLKIIYDEKFSNKVLKINSFKLNFTDKRQKAIEIEATVYYKRSENPESIIEIVKPMLDTWSEKSKVALSLGPIKDGAANSNNSIITIKGVLP